MTNSTFVNVFYSRDKLLENSDGSLFMQSLVLHNIVKKFSVNTIFHDQVKFSFSFDDFVELDDIGVTDFLEYFDFTRDAIYVFSVPNASLFKNFNSYVFLRQNMFCHLYFSKGTFTE